MDEPCKTLPEQGPLKVVCFGQSNKIKKNDELGARKMNEPDRRSLSTWFWDTLRPYLWAIATGAAGIALLGLACGLTT